MWLFKDDVYVKKIQNFDYAFYKFFHNQSEILENACSFGVR